MIVLTEAELYIPQANAFVLILTISRFQIRAASRSRTIGKTIEYGNLALRRGRL
ncbi:hypothetical protein LEP1GSC193_3152 [Leptospira alstonii serovar Pingchang str. 80-412]|uniref:Uncharacterized protein n=2 Tax=Leptospira alstonii TaxID=28452 RepID=M6CNL7_9LEPT|nr:hypothetical protein LEP1GSC194_1642 [Leptospira alstonii serovar Sichuan str. 79601]EQA79369.1 hypothetical protein LEP1GSC193_3152 [Leptospira alstonii serovar Pingchang str. 80-412]